MNLPRFLSGSEASNPNMAAIRNQMKISSNTTWVQHHFIGLVSFRYGVFQFYPLESRDFRSWLIIVRVAPFRLRVKMHIQT